MRRRQLPKVTGNHMRRTTGSFLNSQSGSSWSFSLGYFSLLVLFKGFLRPRWLSPSGLHPMLPLLSEDSKCTDPESRWRHLTRVMATFLLPIEGSDQRTSMLTVSSNRSSRSSAQGLSVARGSFADPRRLLLTAEDIISMKLVG